MRAAIYLRVSSEEQARHGFSLAAQREECRRRAHALGAEEILEFADEGVSASILERPGLERLRAAVRAGRVDLVVILDPDRFARNLAHQLLVTEEIERAGVRLEFVHFDWQDTPEGKLFYALRGAIAEYEREKIRLRTMSGRRQKAKSGRLPIGVAPYGYRYEPATAALVPEPEESPWVRRMYEWAAAGAGPSEIARRLEAEGAPTRRGGPWRRQTVAQILSNPAYAGTFYWSRRDWQGVSLNRFRSPEARRRPRPRPPEEWVAVPVPALVSPGLWAAVNRRPGGAAARGGAAYLLGGLAVCGDCGRRLVGTRRREWGRPTRVYLCERRRGGCGRSARAAELEEAVWRALRPILGEVEASLPAPHADERAPGEDRRRAIERRRQEVLRLVAAGLVDADEAAPILERLGRQAAALAANAERASDRPSAPDAATLLDRLGPEERRQVLKAAVARVVVATTGVATVELRIPRGSGGSDER